MRLPPLLLLLLPALAQAQPTASDPARERAMALYEQGRAASQNNNWKDAHKHFFEAWNLKHHVQIAANLGLAEFKLSMFRDAAEHLDFVLKNAPPGMSSNDRKLTQDMFDQSRQHIGELLVDIDIKEVDIFVDDSPVGKAPMKSSFFVQPGRHIVEARMEGHPIARRSANVKPGSTKITIRISLEQFERGTFPVRVVPKMSYEGGNEPDKMLLIGMWSATSASLVMTGISLGLSAYFQHQIDEKLGPCKAETDIEKKKACIDDYNATVGHWIRSTNTACLVGIAGGVLAGVTLAYTYWPRDKASDREKKIMAGVRGGLEGGEIRVVIPW